MEKLCCGHSLTEENNSAVRVHRDTRAAGHKSQNEFWPGGGKHLKKPALAANIDRPPIPIYPAHWDLCAIFHSSKELKVPLT